MPKNILQDVIPPERRSIRSIPVPRRAPRSIRPDIPISDEPTVSEPPKPPEIETYDQYKSRNDHKPSKKIIWISIGVAVIIVIFAILSLFESATVKITPKEQSVSAIGQLLLADKEGADNSVSFEVIKIVKQHGIPVKATGEKDVEQKASGRIVVYNDYDANSQRLIKNSRFEAPEGLIYRIDESVVVPGQQVKDGKKIPGSIEVTVFADEPGEKYNVGLKDFTIPGFKGDPRFEKMYARSKTDIAGGFVGKMKTVSENDLTTAQGEIHSILTENLAKEIESQLPDSYVIVKDGLFFQFKPIPQSDVKEDSVQVNEEGTLNVIVFNRSLLASYAASKFAPSFPASDVRIVDIENLPIIISEKESFSVDTTTSFEFEINGQIILVANIDEDAIKRDLVGKPKKEISAILSSYVAIDKVQPFVRPMWKRTFPKSEKNIKVEIVAGEASQQ